MIQVPPKYFPYYISNYKDIKQFWQFSHDSCMYLLSITHSKIEIFVKKIVSMLKIHNFNVLVLCNLEPQPPRNLDFNPFDKICKCLSMNILTTHGSTVLNIKDQHQELYNCYSAPGC